MWWIGGWGFAPFLGGLGVGLVRLNSDPRPFELKAPFVCKDVVPGARVSELDSQRSGCGGVGCPDSESLCPADFERREFGTGCFCNLSGLSYVNFTSGLDIGDRIFGDVFEDQVRSTQPSSFKELDEVFPVL